MSDTLTEVEHPDVPTDNLVRCVEFRAEPSDDGLTLEGYGAVFNAPTEIAEFGGTYTEQIAKGAFKRTLGQRTPILQFDHGQHPLIGSLPIGVIRSIREDDHGLKVRARLSDNWLVQPVRDAIRDGAVTGMSFRFRVVNDTWDKSGTVRTIREVELYEVGPVVWPAYESTTVGVRSRQALTLLDDPEVRADIARVSASGTDLRSLADTAAPDIVYAEVTSDAPALVEPREDTRAGRSPALVRAALLSLR